MRLTESQLRNLIRKELQEQLLREFLTSVVKSAEMALKSKGPDANKAEDKGTKEKAEEESVGGADADAKSTERKTSTSAGGGEAGGSGKMFKTTGKTIKTAAEKAKDISGGAIKPLDIAKTPEALKMLQVTSKDFGKAVSTSNTITADIKRLLTKMPTDKASNIKQTGTKSVTKLQQNVNRYFDDMKAEFEDEPTARVATVGMLAQLIVNLDKASK